ncbi:MAG TPA: hypothetical protein PLU73_01005 [Bacteroidia bacterium]|jgi:hypothetical protein|nr:hypothetical protein [Bacteroidia bacterium]
MKQEETFNPQESMQVISSMIITAKNKLADDGFALIFWGWLVTLSALIHYFTILLNIDYGYFVWPVLMPLGGIVSAYIGYKQGKKKKVKTYIDTYLSYLWIAFGVSLAITLIFMPLHGIKTTYFFLMVLYGIATLVSGGILNFKPLIVGSIFSFICAVVSVFLGEKEQLLIIAIALICSYIIPGHMLRSKFKSQNV